MRIGILFSGVLLFGAPAGETLAAAGHYGYAIGCDAKVDKLDTLAERKVGTFDLALRTGNRQIIPQVRDGLDGCLADQAIYDPTASVFYTIVPLQAREKPDGTKDYRVLAFSIPDMRLAGKLRGGDSLADPPHLQMGAGKRVTVAAQWSPRTDLDLGGFAPGRTEIPNQILETSGALALLRLFTADRNELVLAVADSGSRTVVRLQGLPSTVAPSAHLSPGGKAVLAEETALNGSSVEKTGRLVLFEAATGSMIKDLTDPQIKDLAFLAISPTGRAIYHSGDRYRFVNLGTTFLDVPVTRPSSAGYPGFFFADR
jgi:hypothetical protein